VEDLQEVASTLLDHAVPARPSALTEKLSQVKLRIAKAFDLPEDNFFVDVPMGNICSWLAGAPAQSN
jgi:hypothetical protein